MSKTSTKKQSGRYIVYDWMVTDLKLKPVPKEIFAVCWSYAMVGKEYFGSRNNLASRIGVSVRTVDAALGELVGEGLLVKRKETSNGVASCVYSVTPSILERFGAANSALGGVQDMHPSRADSAHNNTNDMQYTPIRCNTNDMREARYADRCLLGLAEAGSTQVTEGEVESSDADRRHIACKGKRPSAVPGAVLTPSQFVEWLRGRKVCEKNSRAWARVRQHCTNSPEVLERFERIFGELAAEAYTSDMVVAAAVAVEDPAGNPKRQWETIKADWVRNFYAKVSASSFGGYSRLAEPSREKSRLELMGEKINRALIS